MRPFAIIVAFDKEYGIGHQNQLPWHLPADLKHFREITTTVRDSNKINAVIMGRNTWESLPTRVRPLPNRRNIVLTNNESYDLPQGVLRAGSLDDSLSNLGSDIDQVFVMGGAKVYQAAIEHSACQSIYVTHVLGQYPCDAFFPKIIPQFLLISASEVLEENGISYQFCHYMR